MGFLRPRNFKSMIGYYKICTTREEKIAAAKYWEKVRQEVSLIRDQSDRDSETQYNQKVIQKAKKYYEEIKKYNIKHRPNFMEPI